MFFFKYYKKELANKKSSAQVYHMLVYVLVYLVKHAFLSEIQKVGWQTLQARRKISDLAMFYKIQYGFVNISFPKTVALSYTATRQNHEHKYMAIQANTQVYKNSVFERTVPVWNSLPVTADKAANVAQFQAAFLPVVANISSTNQMFLTCTCTVFILAPKLYIHKMHIRARCVNCCYRIVILL